MKVSELVKYGIDYLAKYGDGDVKIDLLTENQSNFLDKEHVSVCFHNNNFEIEIDINSKKELMKKIK